MPNQIFMSYSRADTNFVARLIEDLTRQGLSVWMDQRNIGAGQRWDNVIQGALETCDTFVIVLSPNSVASENVLDELSFAINSRKRVIPVLLRNCEMPYRIARLQFVDFTRDYQTGFAHLYSEIVQTAPQRPVMPQKKQQSQGCSQRTLLWVAGAIFAFIACLVVGYGVYLVLPYYFPTDTPVVTEPPVVIVTTPPGPGTGGDTPVPAPHAPEIVNNYGAPLYDEKQQLITLHSGEQYKLNVMDMWSAPEGAGPSCADGFMALTWIVRDPYPSGGEDLQLLRLIPMGDGRTEVFASGSQGATALAYCDEIFLFNNSLQDYRVEIRYASGIYGNPGVPTAVPSPTMGN